MNEADYGITKLRTHESASAAHARRLDGSDMLSENTRYDFMYSRHKMDQAQAMAYRLTEESGPGRARDLHNLPVGET